MLTFIHEISKLQQLKQQNNKSKKLSSFMSNKNCENHSIRTFSLKTFFVPKKRKKLRKRLKRIGRKWLRIKRKQWRRKWRILYKKRVHRVSVFIRRMRSRSKRGTELAKPFLQKRNRNSLFRVKSINNLLIGNTKSYQLLRKYTNKSKSSREGIKSLLSLHIQYKNAKTRKLIKEGKLHRRNVRRYWRKLYSRPWKYRFPRWRAVRRYYSNRKYITGRWGSRDLMSYKAYKLPHQPYRNRRPWQYKSNRWSSQYRYVHKRGVSLRRKQRLLKRQIIYKLYKNYYGIPNRKYLISKNLTFRKVSSYKLPQKLLVLNLFEKRLDVSLCRMNLAPSLKIAQSLIRAGFVYVNNTQIHNVGYSVNTWDLVNIAPDSYIHYLRYWYVRNKFKFYLFKNKGLRSFSVSQEKLTNAFGFRTKLLNEYDLSRCDRIKSKEVERLFLWK